MEELPEGTTSGRDAQNWRDSPVSAFIEQLL